MADERKGDLTSMGDILKSHSLGPWDAKHYDAKDGTPGGGSTIFHNRDTGETVHAAYNKARTEIMGCIRSKLPMSAGSGFVTGAST